MRPTTADRRAKSWRDIVMAVLLAAIAALPPTIIAWQTGNKVDANTVHINSRMTDLINSTVAETRDKATLAEKNAEQLRQGAAAQAVNKAETVTPPRAAPTIPTSRGNQ